MPTMNDKLLSEYMLGKYRQGHDYVAMYLAATLFERTVVDKLKKANYKIYERLSASEDTNNLKDVLRAIKELLRNNSLSVKSIFYFQNVFNVKNTKEAINKLYDYKEIRNEIIHTSDPISYLKNKEKMRNVSELILYVSSENCPVLFGQNFTDIKNYEYDTFCSRINSKKADYLVRSTDEIMINRYDKELKVSKDNWYLDTDDLSDLLVARVKLAQLKNELDNWLANQHPELATTILTTIDTASGYIWLPIVHKAASKGASDRPNLDSPTASILVTPLDVRIYIDFGGYCYKGRKEYFRFIRNKPEFRKFLDQLQGDDRKHFRIFDIEWYSFIVSELDIESIVDNWDEWQSTVDAAEKDLDSSQKTEILTRNRLLSGFIYDKLFIEKSRKIDFDFITAKLSIIINIYKSLIMSK